MSTTQAGELNDSRVTRITGQDEAFAADVFQLLNKNRVSTEAVDVATVIKTNKVTVGHTAVEAKAGATLLANRKLLYIKNSSSHTVYFGDSSVTVSTGFPLGKDEVLAIGITTSVYLISAYAGDIVSVLEAS